MGKKIILSAACLLPLIAAQAASAKPDAARQTRPSVAPKLIAPPQMRQIRPARVDFGDGRIALEGQRRGSRRAPQLVGALAPAKNALVGVGLWRVDKIDDVDPNRAHPLRDTRGRTMGVAAVGFNLSF